MTNDDGEELATIEVNGRRIATVFHAAPKKQVVLFCHGFRGSKVGPNRFFVRLARLLRDAGICSLRFDQYGSGDSEGDFLDSSFDDWTMTTIALAERLLAEGYQVSLLGQSMGGSAVIVAAAELRSRIASVVAWMPDPSVDEMAEIGKHHEEGGQRVDWRFWREAHDAKIIARFKEITAPTLVFLANIDEYVSADNQLALNEAKQPHQEILHLDDHAHSNWTFDQAERIIEQSNDFLCSNFR